jgi:hypothetical protein
MAKQPREVRDILRGCDGTVLLVAAHHQFHVICKPGGPKDFRRCSSASRSSPPYRIGRLSTLLHTAANIGPVNTSGLTSS